MNYTSVQLAIPSAAAITHAECTVLSYEHRAHCTNCSLPCLHAHSSPDDPCRTTSRPLSPTALMNHPHTTYSHPMAGKCDFVCLPRGSRSLAINDLKDYWLFFWLGKGEERARLVKRVCKRKEESEEDREIAKENKQTVCKKGGEP